jgi:hypothetical protein
MGGYILGDVRLSACENTLTHRTLVCRTISDSISHVLRLRISKWVRAVVDEDGGDGGVDVEVVVVAAGDGDVPHPASVLLGSVAAGNRSGDPVGGAERVAVLQLAGLDPSAAPQPSSAPAPAPQPWRRPRRPCRRGGGVAALQTASLRRGPAGRPASGGPFRRRRDPFSGRVLLVIPGCRLPAATPAGNASEAGSDPCLAQPARCCLSMPAAGDPSNCLASAGGRQLRT